jgi:hypothetical protein
MLTSRATDKSCWLRVNPMSSLPTRFSSTGRYRFLLKVPADRTLFGMSIYSQIASFDRSANAAGITLSNALYLRVGR